MYLVLQDMSFSREEVMIRTVCWVTRFHIPEDNYLHYLAVFSYKLKDKKVWKYCFSNLADIRQRIVYHVGSLTSFACLSSTVQWRWRGVWPLVPSISLRRRGFDSKPEYFRFLVEQVALRQVFLWVLLFRPSESCHQCSTPITILILLILSVVQASEVWKHSNTTIFYRISQYN
jgi:hypothetical protein